MCQRLATFAVLFFALPMSVGEARAQMPEAEQVRETVTRFFDAMRAGDGDGLASLFHPDATMKSVSVVDGQARVNHAEVARFTSQVGAPRTQLWDERISNLEVRVDGPFATAWMDYSFYADETFSHCGVNTFELLRSEEGWLVLGITDTRRTTDCPDESAR